MDKLQVLKRVFGYDAFRAGQEQIVDALLSGRDALCVMPTGAGKSLCYQIPALMLPGISLVVSPLISLMKDQVTALNQAGVRAAFLNSSLNAAQYRRALENARQGMYKIIYVAPERLETPEFIQLCAQLTISLLAVDEAHCVSQWGQDFRPSYLRISAFVRALPVRPVLGAFTATATAEVKRDIAALLELQRPFSITTGFDRPNLRFEVRRPAHKKEELLRILAENREVSGIVYCATRKNVEQVCQLLCDQGIPATRYHAGLTDEERKSNQEDFLYDRKPWMVATNAFGMGIDKSNVRLVVHYNMPKNVEAYYQEAGRAGRDGAQAQCILLYSAQDVYTNTFLIENSEDNPDLSPEEAALVKERMRQGLKRMAFYCTTSDCLRGYMLRYFGEPAPDRCGNCSNCTGEFTRQDITDMARVLLECVSETRQRYGRAVILGIVRGASQERLKRLRLDSTGCYGMLKTKSEKELRAVLDELLVQGILVADDGEYPVLRLGERAQAVLYEEEKVYRKVRAEETKTESKKEKGSSASGRSAEVVSDQDPLLHRLKAVRRELADRIKMPAYIVFSDAALKDMCAKKPRNEEEFLQVSGVGAQKLARYGKTFLKAIAEFAENETAGKLE